MSKCSQCAVKELIDSYGGLTEAKARSVKLRGKYNRSGLSNTDYKELLRLEKAVSQAMKGDSQ
ncbi:hypothetical protein PJ611_000056 [Acinetobacter baumannii]|uniref:hypothetical protein n=1 Tax=Acinetobacter baumannii TaxID=470 RepID=UPI000616EBC1|nr:hypothetical protein [Acinetobacter baumannii]MCG9249005.1 hypothetical protein [Acinetobacter baumannii]MCY6971169.1 hypothetical protein [Acinetobacter baumannii]MDA5166593.1 hypothetical protein [Acinetobacter baumannii]MDC7345184.1 hypothetical protein [Acinetobacter baumannii]MDC7371705.1 hypothetical protein [Acinetobacter baumannii]